MSELNINFSLNKVTRLCILDKYMISKIITKPFYHRTVQQTGSKTTLQYVITKMCVTYDSIQMVCKSFFTC